MYNSVHDTQKYIELEVYTEENDEDDSWVATRTIYLDKEDLKAIIMEIFNGSN